MTTALTRLGSVVVLGVVLPLLAMMVYRAWHPGADIESPSGYAPLARLFIRHNLLEVEETTGRVSLNGQATPTARAVFNRTFLPADVEAFNGGQKNVFTVENGLLVDIDPTRHNVTLPFSNVSRWRGSLRYRPTHTGMATLRGVGVQIDVRGLSAPVPSEAWLDETTVRGDMRADPVGRAEGEVVNIYGYPGKYLGKVFLAEDKIIVDNRASPKDVTFSIGGRQLPRGNLAWLAPGDLLKLEWTPGPRERTRYALLWNDGGRSADIISAPCAINGRRARCPDTPPTVLFGELLAALDGAAYSAPTGQVDGDIVLTLDRRLDAEVQQALERSQARRTGRAGGAPQRMTRAAVTVMDALTGELLALASHPTPGVLAGLNVTPDAAASLARNHNFNRMPIGSVAKVVLGAALVDADPRLLTLRLRQRHGSSIDSIAGIRVRPAIESHPVPEQGGYVDFTRFIQYSSNEYAALLLTLGSMTAAGEPLPVLTGPLLGPEGRYEIDGRSFDRAPAPGNRRESRLNLTRADGATVVPGTLSNLEDQPWAKSFRTLFGVSTRQRRPVDERDPASGDEMVDTTVWLPVLEAFYGEDVPRAHPLRAVGFERENLALNLGYQFRTDFLSLIFGGAAARFTNPMLAEMFSRLVTGRKIERSLVMGVVDADEDPPAAAKTFAPLELDDQVRARLLDAMAAVAQGGTAGSLAGALRRSDDVLRKKGKALGFFSKTGSPRNTVAVPSGLALAVNELIRDGAVVVNGQDVLTYRGVPVTEDPDDQAVPPALRALQDHTADRERLRRRGVSPRLVHDALLLYNVESEERRPLWFSIRNGRIVSMHGVRNLPATGAVYVFTIAIYDGAARRSATPLDVDAIKYQPERAWTVAINIQGQGKSTDVAVPFAESLLNDVLWPALER